MPHSTTSSNCRIRWRSSVAGVIEPALQAAETARSASRPNSDLTAYDLYLRALAMPPPRQPSWLSSCSRKRSLVIRIMDRRSRWRLNWYMNSCQRRLHPGSGRVPTQGHRLCARRALAVARNDPGVLADAAFALACFGEDIRRRDDRAGRSRSRLQPELRARLVGQQFYEAMGRPDGIWPSNMPAWPCGSARARRR